MSNNLYTDHSSVAETIRCAPLQPHCLLNTPPDHLCDLITGLVSKLLRADISLISLVDEDRYWFKSKRGTELTEAPRKDSFCTHAINESQALVVLDASQDARFADNPFVLGAPHIRFYAGAPLISQDQICLGVLCVIGNTARDTFSEGERHILEQLATLTTARLELLRTSGYVDSLTALPNRARFAEDLRFLESTASNLRQSLTAVCIDVCHRDYFVDMIKALGWDYAEGFLQLAAGRLTVALQGHAVYRIGTTLFAYLTDADDVALLRQIEHLREQFNIPLEHHGIPYTLDITAGIVPMPADVSNEDVVRCLFTAADLAREDGSGQRVYEESQGASQKHIFDILSAIPHAIRSGKQFTLHYQPKVSLSDGNCAGVEALIRWQHPEFGNISPAKFIPPAEKTALIRRVTRWALQEGIAQARKWLDLGQFIPVAINVSARDFDTDELPELLQGLLKLHAIPAGLVEIEFTESAISKNPHTLRQKLMDIKQLGVKIAIDDFGAGFSNLSYLKNIPADHMKIDGSFIQGLISSHTDRTIVRSIIGLGHELGFVIVAEGIESEQTLALLRQLGCDQGQGYAIARPMPATGLEIWLQERAVTP